MVANKQFTMRVSKRWINEMKKLAEKHSQKSGRPMSVSLLIKEACKILYKIRP